MSTYRERRLARAERLADWAEKRAARASGGFTRAHDIVKNIPMGQPILVGHHSERHHRRDLARHDSAMRGAIADQDKSREMSSKSAEILHQADHAIYDDDPDAIERLREKLETLEAERERMKAANTAYRKGDAKFAAHMGVTIEEAAAMRTKIAAGYSWCQQPYPSYSLQNLGGNITRARQRLARLVSLKTSRGAAVVADAAAAASDDPIVRAGLVIEATETRPAKAWKKPRPVWNISGNLAFWRPLLIKAGASEYHGTISFWEDPSELIAELVREQEQPAATTEPDQPEQVQPCLD